jgi:hypothetical protein
MNVKWFIDKVLVPVLLALLAAFASLVAARIIPNPFADPFPLAGTWEGTSVEGVIFRFTFASKCDVGDVCGKVELPTVGCTAIPVLVSTDGVTYEFDETNHQNCGPDTANDTIKVLGDGTLLFGSVGQSRTIILYRK